MNKLKKIVREDNFLSLAGNVVIAILGVAGFGLLARSLSLEVFGEWVLFITGGSFVEMFRFGITNTGLIRYLSGADDSSRYQLIGSNALIGLGATVLVAFILIVCNLFFGEAISNSGYGLFFKWYPLLAFLNLPWNNALVVLQADREYGKILALKSINSGLFFLVIVANSFFIDMTLSQLVVALLIINAVTSLTSLLLGWDGVNHITKACKSTNRTLLNFGKFTTFTLIGTNLLRSADALIISLSPLGASAVALYSIPLKLTELQQIPLRSFVATAFPKMSKASVQGRVNEVKDLFYAYSGALTYLFVAMSLCTFIFADLLVLILSGEQYLVVDPETGFNVVDIVRVFSIYGLLLPIDRMTGIGLDSINKPNINAVKVFVMVLANVIGDVVAIFMFESLILVAVASILFTLVGIWLGMYFLNKELTLSYKQIFISGIEFYKDIFRKAMGNRSTEVNQINN
ncbi:lipopolysaccharide biosynthesis protein [Seonamhaeicola sp. ML3]|uniref:lipopolysaccharide biosynthesis protein n=1 Tax=Seonamhaeicola sp. ML3 TaxID=2937786 RepID=UPI00200EC26E|nr:lipopolysaccharide biosynthesis protein [Seonamhaeicola sp. ML3]